MNNNLNKQEGKSKDNIDENIYQNTATNSESGTNSNQELHPKLELDKYEGKARNLPTGKIDIPGSSMPITEPSNNNTAYRAGADDKYEYFEDVPLEELDDIGLLKRMILSANKCSDLLDYALPRLSEFNHNCINLPAQIHDIELYSKAIFLLFEEEKIKREEFLNRIPKQIIAEISPEHLKSINNFNRITQIIKQMPYTMVGVFTLAILFLSICGYWGIQNYKTGIRTKIEYRSDFLQELKSEGSIIVKEKDFLELKNNTNVLQQWIKKYPRDSDGFIKFSEGYRSSDKER
ncbi:hypothetical protein AB9J70_09490 [Elizabethkingia anophelis]|uniref:hypothetical protein n=1 Tax=Elizabethkingia anophelis TaxID=1117645 RepID=UPI003557AD71